MKVERNEEGALRIEADGIEVLVHREDESPHVTQTLSPNASRKTMNQVAKVLASPSKWPTRKITCI